ncbi:MIF4G like protein [Oesophagostomum dentatum]|uniref:MIF4G like protein n=1 Tax=Oesophagostomum dentatum TaxID=61180 RepID=A0A0B1SE47_OESDE|nr:MIF4G like protein [Oesophagostomum dentatum]
MSRADDNAMMAEMRETEGRYDPDLFGIFFAVLLKTSAKSFSHTFVALSRYSTTLKTVADTSDEMQEVLLCCLFQCWRNNHLRIIILVDKMLKMQILDCGVVISWIFSEGLRSENDRQWIWEVLNTALERLSRHIHKVAHDVKILRKRVDRQKAENEEMEENDQKTREQEELEQQQEKLDNLKDFQKSLFLDVLHKFTVLLTEFIVHCETEGTDFRTPYFAWINGRFKQIFLMVGFHLISSVFSKSVYFLNVGLVYRSLKCSVKKLEGLVLCSPRSVAVRGPANPSEFRQHSRGYLDKVAYFNFSAPQDGKLSLVDTVIFTG